MTDAGRLNQNTKATIASPFELDSLVCPASPPRRYRLKTVVDTSIIPSPLRAKLQRIPPRDTDKWFQTETAVEVNGNLVPCIQYKTKGQYLAAITVEKAKEIISCSVTVEGELYNVKWLDCADKMFRSAIL